MHRAEVRRARGTPPGQTANRTVRRRLLPAAIGRPCPRCGVTMTADNVDLDHTVPRALGGTGSGDRILCSPCNRSMGGSLGQALRR